MFLHSGASLHGHEYSTARTTPTPPPTRIPFLRSALRQQTPEPDMRPPVMRASTTPTPTERPPLHRPMSYHDNSSPSPRSSRPRPTSACLPKRELSVRFKDLEDLEPEEEVTTPDVAQSEDEGSIACSDLSDLSDSSISNKPRRRRKRAPRRSSQFILAHPAPRLRNKQRRLVQTRPRLMLQLQELSDKRATPTFDIIPSTMVAGSIIIPRLAMRCPRLFRAKPQLGINDLLVVRSEDYDTPTSSNSSDVEDNLDQRDLLAVISPLPHMGDNGAEIVMEDGSTWESSLLPNGSYEFIGVDERGGIRTARWVKKPVTAPRPPLYRTNTDTPPSSPLPLEEKYTFSIINPDRRRHPIMGSLINSTLEIFDTFNTMSASSGRYPPTRPTLDGGNDGLPNMAPPKEARFTMAVPDDIKLLMVATAAWVQLRHEGWPASGSPRPTQNLSHRRTASFGAPPPRTQTFPARGGGSLASIPQNVPQTKSSPPLSYVEPQVSEASGRRKSISSSSPGFVKRLVAPRASMDGPNRPTLETICYNEIERPPTSRRLSVRSLTNKIFRRRSNSTAQQENIYEYKLDY
jgi:hypothetical protein